MNYDIEFLESAGIANKFKPAEDDRRARAIFWRIAIPLLIVVDILFIAAVVELLAFLLR